MMYHCYLYCVKVKCNISIRYHTLIKMRSIQFISVSYFWLNYSYFRAERVVAKSQHERTSNRTNAL